ncbi:TPA: LOW QUALITY PROTEIN: hypothetical protein N0F65_007172 [Lagenidium giganteum]|uniref:Transposase n=1 Tax=Lagenidium giganteum TaxID=4803 RepID=A0AAV2Z4R2_9STRA|nr:TPA: LOW QUALITY PROTEIN: hypothetical protein N0F65_007172 [Lagenidium giganteum]
MGALVGNISVSSQPFMQQRRTKTSNTDREIFTIDCARGDGDSGHDSGSSEKPRRETNSSREIDMRSITGAWDSGERGRRIECLATMGKQYGKELYIKAATLFVNGKKYIPIYLFFSFGERCQKAGGGIHRRGRRLRVDAGRDDRDLSRAAADARYPRQADMDALTAVLFNALDTDETGVVEALEFLGMIAVMSAMTIAQKLTCTCESSSWTLHRKIAKHKSGIVDKSPGPSPILGDAEQDLYDWAVGMQCKGYPVSRPMLLIKRQEVYSAIFGKTRTVGTIGLGWCERFLQRHPTLTLRNAQLVRRKRNDINDAEVSSFFIRCLKALLETKAESDRIFNMDETAFVQNAKTKRKPASTSPSLLAALRRRLWCLPVFILPGKRINRDVLDACAVPRARVTTTDTAFTNADLIISWIAFFAAEVPTPLRRPLVLFLDGATAIDPQQVAVLSIATDPVGTPRSCTTSTLRDEVFQRRFRIPRGAISNLVQRFEAFNLLAPKVDALGVFGHSREQKLAAALRILAYGTASDATDGYCRIGASMAICVMKEFCRAVIDGFSSQFLRPPSVPELIEICRLNSLRGFPGMDGSLDGTHWEWRACPKAYAGQFKGRYKKPSVVIEAVATQDLRIWHVFFGVPGTCNDITVLERSPLLQDYLMSTSTHNNITYRVKGSCGMADICWLTASTQPCECFPISQPANMKETQFTRRQESCRKDVERFFGVLKGRFHIIDRPS